MKIGARTIKTGLAVALTFFLINLLESKVGVPEYNISGTAAITAVIGMQPSIKSTLDTFKNRIIATIIGTLAAFLIGLTLGMNALWIGLGSIAIVLICLKLELHGSIRFALVTLCAVGAYNDFLVVGALYRVLGMFIGIVVSTGLNILIMPPDYTDNLKDKIHILRRKFEKLYQNAIEDLLREEKIEKETIKNKRQVIRNELDETRELYNLLLEDNIPKNRASLEKYRRSINAIQSNLDRLMAIHRSIIFMPDNPAYLEIRKELFRYLENLLTLHRRIYDQITLNKEYCNPEISTVDTATEKLRKNISSLIKSTDDEDVFEFYNIYFEGTRINEKLEQLKEEFELPVKARKIGRYKRSVENS
ncbi:MAG: aromatic acid exporter family protein [Dethiobacteria bacterium]